MASFHENFGVRESDDPLDGLLYETIADLKDRPVEKPKKPTDFITSPRMKLRSKGFPTEDTFRFRNE